MFSLWFYRLLPLFSWPLQTLLSLECFIFYKRSSEMIRLLNRREVCNLCRYDYNPPLLPIHILKYFCWLFSPSIGSGNIYSSAEHDKYCAYLNIRIFILRSYNSREFLVTIDGIFRHCVNFRKCPLWKYSNAHKILLREHFEFGPECLTGQNCFIWSGTIS